MKTQGAYKNNIWLTNGVEVSLTIISTYCTTHERFKKWKIKESSAQTNDGPVMNRKRQIEFELYRYI